MTPYVIIQLAGKQYKVSAGDKIVVDRLDQEPDTTFTISDVLLSSDGSTVKVGTPLISGVTVTLKALENTRSKKLRVATYKAKSRYRKVRGHRQNQTVVEVVSI